MLRDNRRTIPVRVPGIGSALWVRAATSDVETFEEIFLQRQYDLPFPDLMPKQILDLGANIGLAAVLFAARWPQARILSVEPVAENFSLLVRNTAPWPQITPLHAAVWACSGEMRVTNPSDAANAYRMAVATGGLEAAVATETTTALSIAELMNVYGGERWDLVKMDVEGAEAEILRDGADWLDRVGVLVIELHDRIVPGCTQALCDALQGRRYRMEIAGGNLAFDFR
jgi:FkbM family methyltransferase